MVQDITEPTLGAKSFTCPHCSARAHQTWYHLYVDGYDQDTQPWMPSPDILKNIESSGLAEGRVQIREYFRKILTRKPFKNVNEQGLFLRSLLENVYVSQCYSCQEWAVWVADDLVFPHQRYSVAPTTDMPENIKTDFLEAAAIVDLSPRGAAALLRLCIQKVVIFLGEAGDNLNHDIGQLVEKRVITSGIQKALDVVRVVGNNAVHPGVIDFNDNKAIAIRLFGLVNVIVESTIAAPKHIQDVYESVVPESARVAIEKRDGTGKSKE